MHLPHASNQEEKCVPTTKHKVHQGDITQGSKGVQPQKDAYATCTKPRGKVCAYHQSQSLLK